MLEYVLNVVPQRRTYLREKADGRELRETPRRAKF